MTGDHFSVVVAVVAAACRGDQAEVARAGGTALTRRVPPLSPVRRRSGLPGDGQRDAADAVVVTPAPGHAPVGWRLGRLRRRVRRGLASLMRAVVAYPRLSCRSACTGPPSPKRGDPPRDRAVASFTQRLRRRYYLPLLLAAGTLI